MLKSKIGTNAGEIWQFLDTNGEKSISEIEKALSMKKPDVLIALGWLAREDKICNYSGLCLLTSKGILSDLLLNFS